MKILGGEIITSYIVGKSIEVSPVVRGLFPAAIVEQ